MSFSSTRARGSSVEGSQSLAPRGAPKRQLSRRGSTGSRGGGTASSLGSQVVINSGPADDAERERNRSLLKMLAKDHETLAADHDRLEAEEHQERKDINRLEGELRSLRTELQQQMQETFQAEVGALRQEIAGLRAELGVERQGAERAEAQVKQLQQEFAKVKQQASKHTNEVKEQQRDIQRLNQRLHEIKGEKGNEKQEIERLKQGLQSNNQVTRIESKVDLSIIEFSTLKQQIYDRGLLQPQRTEPVDEKSPPVGTLELCEDVFTARLLMRLSYEKEMLEVAAEGMSSGFGSRNAYAFALGTPARELELSPESDTDTELSSDELEALEQFKNVGGIMAPQMNSSGGHYQLYVGWTAICICTILLQVIVVLLMMHFYYSTTPCYEADEVPVPFHDVCWWVLHLSRGFAMVVAGSLMTQDLMDSMNCLMVSVLLEPHLNCGVVASFIARFLLNALLVITNVLLLMSFVDAGYLWVNMAALNFVASLDQDVLGLAKRGVFGHAISKAVTGVKYELTFQSKYPTWFHTVKRIAINLCIVGVVIAGIVVFLIPDDRICS